MKILSKLLYNITFWISRIIAASIIGVGLFLALNIKYFWFEINFSPKFVSCSRTILELVRICFGILGNIGSFISIHIPVGSITTFGNFCKNSQNIDLLLIVSALILVISIITIKICNICDNKYKYLFAINTVSFIVYVIMYLIFGLSIMFVLAIIMPITTIIITILNKICPIQKAIMLIPIIGDVFCIKSIVKHIYKDSSKELKEIILLIVAIIVSNIICFSISYEEKEVNGYFLDGHVSNIKNYKDGMIAILRRTYLVLIDQDGNNTTILNDEFDGMYYLVINKEKKEIYIYGAEKFVLLILDFETLDIKQKIKFNEYFKESSFYDWANFCCNNDFSKLLFASHNISYIYPNKNVRFLIDLNTHKIVNIYDNIYENLGEDDSIIYNKYRKCFLLTVRDMNFLQEIDIENNKVNYIELEKFAYDSYITMSNKNKEIYISFYHQGKIAVYDAETMELKRKITTNYTVKNITYDEELNVLIAPSYFTGYVDIFLMDGSDKLLMREFIGNELGEVCFDSQKENLYICADYGLYKKKIDIKRLIKEKNNIL